MDIPDISKPATLLIEKVANSIGVLYEPTRIVKKAKAEAIAHKILKLSEIEIDEIDQRSISRLLIEERYKQVNIENVIKQALPLLMPNANPEKISNDWLINFFDKVKTISDEYLQNIWSSLLANQANYPGLYSKKTISIVSEMDKKNAIDFQNLCKFVFNVNDENIVLIYNHEDEIYKKNDIKFYELTIFETLGLVKFDVLDYLITGLDVTTNLIYGNKKYSLLSVKQKKSISTGKVLFTPYGKELAGLCKGNYNQEIFNYFEHVFQKEGFEIISRE